MVKLTCIYTRAGDRGKTSLGDGSRVKKHDLRMDAIGTVDELNAALGLVKTYFGEQRHSDIIDFLQHDLFDVGANKCRPQPQSR